MAGFYRRTVNLIVGYSVGGGYDTYARIFARRRQAIGNPQVVVQNMPGAGSEAQLPLQRRAQGRRNDRHVQRRLAMDR